MILWDLDAYLSQKCQNFMSSRCTLSLLPLQNFPIQRGIENFWNEDQRNQEGVSALKGKGSLDVNTTSATSYLDWSLFCVVPGKEKRNYILFLT